MGEEVVPPEGAPEINLPASSPRDPRRLGKPASTRPSRYDLGLVFRTAPHKIGRLSYLHEGHKVMAPVLGSGTAREDEWAVSRRGVGRRKNSASSPEIPLTAERAQRKRQKLKHGTTLYLVSQGRLADYDSSRCLDRLAASATFKSYSGLSLTLLKQYFESGKSCSVALLCPTFIPEEN